jgi:hypothetical protein
LTRIISPERRGPQSTTRARMPTAWQSLTSLCWNWPRSLPRAESDSTSASNLSSRKSSPGSSFCQSVAGHAPAPWDFQRLIPKIQQIASSRPPRWSRGYPCLPPTVPSAGREWFKRFGENNGASPNFSRRILSAKCNSSNSRRDAGSRGAGVSLAIFPVSTICKNAGGTPAPHEVAHAMLHAGFSRKSESKVRYTG